MDPYQACPCGSGKNFKWCCQPYFAQVGKARQLHEQGQQDTALRTIKGLVDQQPNNAPVLGYQAELLYMNGKPDEADDALQRAFAINPAFALGHWLRGMIRKDEGEIVGALIQFRRAAELYDPKAHEVLADIEAGIFDIEMRLNRPVAARAALERAMRHDATAEPLRNAFQSLFGAESRLPEAARKGYVFRPASPARLKVWQSTLPATAMGRLGEAQKVFLGLTTSDPTDAPAWFNLGVVRAWLGENADAIDALAQSIQLETDLPRITEAGALIETLLCGEGLEEQSDYIEHRLFFQMQQAEPVVKLLEEWQRAERLSGAQQDQENGTLSALVLEETPHFGVGIGTPAAKLGAYMLVVGNIMRLWSPRRAGVDAIADEVMRKVGAAVNAPVHEIGYCNFSDIAMEAMLFPTRETRIEEIADRLREHAEEFFETIWLQRPLKSLGGVAPLDAAAHPTMRKKLHGLVSFVEQCFISSSPRVSDGENLQIVVVYDFNRLRRKLNLLEGPALESASGPNLDLMSTAELAAVNASELDDTRIEQAYRAALKLDARDLAGTFAKSAVTRDIADRYPFFNLLVNLAQAEGDHPGVLHLLEQAQAADAATNGSARQNDYALRRGQALAKQGQADAAYSAFKELLDRAPDELKLYGPAVESLLNQKQGARALELAERGLTQARAKQNRDVEGYLQELAAAARKLPG